MFWLILLPFFSCGLDVSYLNFNPSSNPTQRQVNLTVSSAPTDVSYGVELWFRPVAATPDSGSYPILAVTNDWTASYLKDAQGVQVLSQSGFPLCTIPRVAPNVWTHIAFTFDVANGRTFSCYKNATIAAQPIVSAPTISKSPDVVRLGNNYVGNYFELRIWTNYAPTAANLLRNFTNYFVAPYNPSLTKYYRLNLGSYNATIEEYISTASVPISSLYFSNLWLKESPGSLILCSPGNYTLGSNCAVCPASCSYCQSAAISNCFSTSRTFLNLQLLPSTTSLKFSYPSNILTIEFWFYPFAWNSGLELFSVGGVVTVMQRGSSPIVSFYDGNSNELFNFTANTGQWVHVAVVLQAGSRADLYVNYTTVNVMWTINKVTDPFFYIGSNSTKRFQGYIADLRLWTTSKTYYNILGNMNVNYTVKPSDLAVYCPLNDTISKINCQASTLAITGLGSYVQGQDCTSTSCNFWCPALSFMNMATGVCQSCDPSCLACNGSSSSNCTLCPSGSYQTPGINNCLKSCPSGYVTQGTLCQLQCNPGFYNNSFTCTSCPSYCSTCSNSSYCTSCPQGYNLFTNISSQNCILQCGVGQFANASNNYACVNCSSNCLTCYGNSSYCTSCSSNLYMYNNTCTSNCTGSRYNVSMSCYDCDQSCATCSGPGAICQCKPSYPYTDAVGTCYQTCPSFFTNVNKKCLSACATGTYALTSKQCVACDSSCLECSGVATNCTACQNMFYNNTCLAVCPSNTFNNESICINCDPTCATCSGQSTNCTSCSIANPYFYDTACYTQCPVNTFTLQQYMTCYDTCPTGYFVNQTYCQLCDNSCGTCTSTSTNCISCPTNKFLYNNTCVLACPAGTFPLDGMCSNCSKNCTTCLSLNFCTGCSNNSLYLDVNAGSCVQSCSSMTYTLNQTCLQRCPRSYYAVTGPNMCKTCPLGCLDCTSNSPCQTCVSGFYYMEGSCPAQCPLLNFFANQSSLTCSRCDPNCTQCTGPFLSNCSQCSNSRFIYTYPNQTTTCLSSCPDGTYKTNTMCQACQPTCKTCSNNSTCLSCATNQYSRSDMTCAATCYPGDLVNIFALTCISYTSLSPSGNIDLSTFSLIQITYPVPVSIGSGNFSLFSVENNTFNFIGTFYMLLSTSVALGSSIATSIPTSFLNYDTQYSIQYSDGAVNSAQGGNLNIPLGVWNFTVNPYKLQPLVVVINNGTRGLQVNKGAAAVLDASNSFDPSASYVQSVLSMVWNCSDFSNSYAQYSRNSGTSWSNYVTSVSANDPTQGTCAFWRNVSSTTGYVLNTGSLNQDGGVFRFTFTLKDGTVRNTTKDVFVMVVPSTYLLVGVDSLPIYRVNTDMDLQLAVKNPQIGGNSTYQWSCASSVVYLTKTNSWVLAIAAYSMQPSSQYTFSLMYSDTNSQSSTVISIYTNSPPSSGTLTADRTTGTSLTDTITLQMLGWIDTDVPLTYSFMMVTNYSNTGYFITNQQSSPILVNIYSGGQIQIIGYCYDSLGSRSSSNLTLSLTPLGISSQILDAVNNLPSSIISSNIFSTLQAIQVLSIELNSTHPDINLAIQAKTSMLNLLIKSKTAADSTFATKTNSDALYMYAQILGVAQDLARYPANANLVNGIMVVVNSIDFTRLSTKPTIYPIAGNSTFTAKSPQGQFRNEELEQMALTLSNLIDLVSAVDGANLTYVSSLVNTLATVFSIGTVVTQFPRAINASSMAYVSSKALISALEGSNIPLDSGVSVSVPGGLQASINATQAYFFAAIVNSNPYSSNSTIALNQYMTVELRNIQTNAAIVVSGLTNPFLLSFNVSRSTLKDIQTQSSLSFGGSKILPECSYWNQIESQWDNEGCSLSNIGGIYTYFDYQNIPESFNIICSCNHLSQFSVNFYSNQQLVTTSYIINKDNSDSFSTTKWETSIVFYLLVSGLATFIVCLSLAYYWDNYNPGLSSPSLETEKSFNYWDPNRVETVLSELQKDFINQLSGSRKGDKIDTVASVAQILNSGLVNKLMSRNFREKKDEREVQRKKNFHPVEIVMNGDSDDEGIGGRTKAHLKKGINDPRFVPTLVNEQKGRQVSKKDLENTKAQLRLYLNHLETNTQLKTPVDLFLERFDDSEKLPPALRSKLKLDRKELKVTDLQALGIGPDEFKALRVYKNGEIAADSTKLTGGKYCNLYLAEKIVEDAKRLHGSLKLPYWSLVWLYICKEHKYVAMLFNLHIEYTKKQMLVLASVFWYQQLLFCQLFIAYLNWEWSKEYNQSGNCVWGCNYESQLLAGVVCAIMPWPLYYLCKYLFARNVTEESGPFAFKVQAHQNKLCREIIGTLLSFLIILCSSIGILVVCVKEPFDVSLADDFLYCYLASMVWSLIIGELLATLAKAWLVWMASLNRNQEEGQSDPGFWARFAKQSLILFPCMLPTEL